MVKFSRRGGNDEMDELLSVDGWKTGAECAPTPAAATSSPAAKAGRDAGAGVPREGAMMRSRVWSAMTVVVAVALGVLVASEARLLAQERMSMIPADKMSDAQKKAVADYKAIRNVDLTGPPWSLLLRVPDLVVPSLQIRLHYLNSSALNPKLTELRS